MEGIGMFFSSKGLTCDSCKREITENEKIAIVAYANEINGITNLKKFADLHTTLCSNCMNNS
jgi:hypothetical protein